MYGACWPNDGTSGLVHTPIGAVGSAENTYQDGETDDMGISLDGIREPYMRLFDVIIGRNKRTRSFSP
jgi:hypothetical protein